MADFFGNESPEDIQHNTGNEPSIIESFTKGLLSKANSMVSPEEDLANRLGQPNALPSSEQGQKGIDKLFPREPTTTCGNVAKDLGSTAGCPLTYAFGPASAIQQGVGSATTSYLNSTNPNHPLTNVVTGTSIGALTPAQSIGKGISALLGKSDILKAQDAMMGGERTTAAGVSDNPLVYRFVRGLRESPFSGAIDSAETRAKEAATGSFDQRAGLPSTRTELGTNLQSAATNWNKADMRSLQTRANNLQNAIPKDTPVDVEQELSDLRNQFVPGPSLTPEQAGTSSALSRVNDLYNKAKDYAGQLKYGSAWGAPGGYKSMGMANDPATMTIGDIRLAKNNASDRYKQYLLGGNQNVGDNNDRIIWGKLADLEQKAMDDAGYGNMNRILRNDWEQHFTAYKDNISQFTQETKLTPVQAIDKLLPETRFKDVDKLRNTLSLLPTDIKEDISSYVIDKLGRKIPPEGGEATFDPRQFARSWSDPKVISPEMKQYLFGADGVKDYDTLVTAIGSLNKSILARNPSQTAGTGSIRDLMKQAGRAATSLPGLAGIGAGAGLGANAYYSQAGSCGYGRAATDTGIGAGLGYAVMMALGPKLLSSPAVVRYMATNPPFENLPPFLRAVAANNPQLRTEASVAIDKLNSFKPPQQQSQGFQGQNPTYTAGEHSKSATEPAPQLDFFGNKIENHSEGGPIHYQSGGMVGCTSWPNQGAPGATAYLEGGPTFGNPVLSHNKLMSGPGARERVDQQGYALGGLTKTRKPPTTSPNKMDPLANYPAGYACGGPSLCLAQAFQPQACNASSCLAPFHDTHAFADGGTVKHYDRGPNPCGGNPCGYIEPPTSVICLFMNTPKPYVGGGAVWCTTNGNGGLGYAAGGTVPNMSDKNRYLHQMPPSVRDPCTDRNVLWPPQTKDAVGLAQGGISYSNSNYPSRTDSRPFYNCQLPGVKGGGWAGGGPVGSPKMNTPTEINGWACGGFANRYAQGGFTDQPEMDSVYAMSGGTGNPCSGGKKPKRPTPPKPSDAYPVSMACGGSADYGGCCMGWKAGSNGLTRAPALTIDCQLPEHQLPNIPDTKDNSIIDTFMGPNYFQTKDQNELKGGWQRIIQPNQNNQTEPKGMGGALEQMEGRPT